uniref:Dehydrogenase/reductase 13 n=1 Tax=Falco tinnunculus TaxID=100819 RepID=A0A8C4XM64_FALTI
MGWALLGAGLLLALYTLLRHGLRRAPPPRAPPALRGRTAIVTGGSGGIGAATALELARGGARVVLAARSASRGEAAARRIRTETGNEEVRFMQLDLASLRSVRAFASTFLRQEPHLHLLINNAGEPPGPFPSHPAAAGAAAELCAQPRGHRRLPRPLCWPPAPRHPGPRPARAALHLPGLLRQQVGQRAACPRAGHAPAGHPGDMLRRAPREQQCAQGCLCMVHFLHGADFARRIPACAVSRCTERPLHGFVNTELFRHMPLWLKPLFQLLAWLFFLDASEGAQTSLHCATHHGLECFSGRYFANCRPQEPWPAARDDRLAQALWEASERLVGLVGPGGSPSPAPATVLQ